MFHWIALIWANFPKLVSQKARDEAYLSEAVDVYDLERRMHHIDHRNAYPLGYGTERY